LNTDHDGGCDQQLSNDHQRLMRLAVPEIWLVLTKI